MPRRGWDGGQAAKRARKTSENAVGRSAAKAELPPAAVQRLTEQAAEQGTPGAIFTSDLSVNELALVGDMSYRPLGQVMGSSIFHVGMASGVSAASGELQSLTRAFYSARHFCLGRLQQEAAILGATAVTGIRLEHKMLEWAKDSMEFQAIGTAVRRGTEKLTPETLPSLSSLSGQEMWMLEKAGFRPVGIAIGNCTYFQVTPMQRVPVGQSAQNWLMQNRELTHFSKAMYKARSMAVSRMEGEAAAVKAEGIVGVIVDIDVKPTDGASSDAGPSLVYHFTVIGTAVQKLPGSHPQPVFDSSYPWKTQHRFKDR